MSYTEAAGADTAADTADVDDDPYQVRFSVGSPISFRRRSPPSAVARCDGDEVLSVDVPAGSGPPQAAVTAAEATSHDAAGPPTEGRQADAPPAELRQADAPPAKLRPTGTSAATWSQPSDYGDAASAWQEQTEAAVAAEVGCSPAAAASGYEADEEEGADADDSPAGAASNCEPDEAEGVEDRSGPGAADLAWTQRLTDETEEADAGEEKGLVGAVGGDDPDASRVESDVAADSYLKNKVFAGNIPFHPRRGRLADPTGPCYIHLLPAELLHHVLSYLTTRQQVEVQRVCRPWKAAVVSVLAGCRELDLRQYFPPSHPRRLSDTFLHKLLRLMPALRCLRTGSASSYFSRNALDIVSQHCRELTEIDLDAFSIDDDSLQRLCVSCPRLELVQVPSYYDFSESSVSVVLHHLPRLRALDLNQSNSVTGRCFALLPASLERLSVAGCSCLMSTCLRHAARCPLLSELDVSDVQGLCPDDVAAVVAACGRLQRLNLTRTDLAPEQCVPRAGASHLRHLELNFLADATDTTLRQLPLLLPGLQSLSLQGCTMLTEQGLTQLRRFRELRVLRLCYLTVVSNSTLETLHDSLLTELHLAKGNSAQAQFTADGVKRVILGCRSLKLLNLSCVQNVVTQTLVDDLESQLSSDRDVTIYRP